MGEKRNGQKVKWHSGGTKQSFKNSEPNPQSGLDPGTIHNGKEVEDQLT